MDTAKATLVIRVAMAELAAVAAWADDFARRIGLAAETSFAIQLCLEEAVSNIIRHGFRCARDPDGAANEIRLALQARDASVVMTIEDFGTAFDPLSAPDPPEPPRSIDAAPVGGHGIHLMRRFARSLRYERRDDMNRLTLCFEAPVSTP